MLVTKTIIRIVLVYLLHCSLLWILLSLENGKKRERRRKWLYATYTMSVVHSSNPYFSCIFHQNYFAMHMCADPFSFSREMRRTLESKCLFITISVIIDAFHLDFFLLFVCFLFYIRIFSSLFLVKYLIK